MSHERTDYRNNNTIKTYRDLKVWQRSMQVVTEVYRFTKSFPSDEQYGLTNQIRRSAISVPSNMAEGYGRGTTGDYVRFLRISVGSLYELQTQWQIAQNLGYITKRDFVSIYDETRNIERMLSALIGKLTTRNQETA